jgi:hypothetical protein
VVQQDPLGSDFSLMLVKGSGLRVVSRAEINTGNRRF